MDFTKTALIAGIALTLYYLLLQWPNETIVVEKGETKTNNEIALIESKDSLVSVDDQKRMSNFN